MGTGTRTVSQGIWAVGQMVSMLNAGFVAITRALASRVQRVQPNRTPQAVPSTTNPAFRIIGSQAATNQSRPVVMPTGRMFDAGNADDIHEMCRFCAVRPFQ